MAELSYSEGKTNELRAQVLRWEEAGGYARENEAAEAFTRLWAELDAYLAGGGELPQEWAAAIAPLAPGADSGIPHVRVYVQDAAGAWWLPEPANALVLTLQAATADVTQAAITATEAGRIKDAMRLLGEALDRRRTA
jgi:hypothetical protein